MGTYTADDYTEIYHTDSTAEARKILDVILLPQNIEAVIHDRSDKALPAAGQPGGYYIAVPGAQREQAAAILQEAVDNGYLEGGAMIPPATP
jgi:hypothetical protein